MNQRDSEGMVLSRREVPKLGGSSAGFIVLIVALCLIILAAAIAIYFLLREERTSDEELAKRRRKSSRKEKYGIPADDARMQRKFWYPRRFFFTRTNQAREMLPVQSVEDLPSQTLQPSEINWMTSPNKRDSALTMSTSYGSHFRSLASPISPSGVRFDDTPSVRVYLPPERDRFAPSPSSPPSHLHMHLTTPPISAPSSPTIPPYRTGHSGPANISIASSSQQAQHERDIALRSMENSGPTTFEGGSRFLEAF